MIVAGYTITEPALQVATTGVGGYPFLLQLVGFWICKLANTTTAASETGLIDETTAAAGVQAARRRLGSLIHEPALRDPVTCRSHLPGRQGH